MHEMTVHLRTDEGDIYHTLHIAWQDHAGQPQLTDIALHLPPDGSGTLEVFINGRLVACVAPGLLKETS